MCRVCSVCGDTDRQQKVAKRSRILFPATLVAVLARSRGLAVLRALSNSVSDGRLVSCIIKEVFDAGVVPRPLCCGAMFPFLMTPCHHLVVCPCLVIAHTSPSGGHLGLIQSLRSDNLDGAKMCPLAVECVWPYHNPWCLYRPQITCWPKVLFCPRVMHHPQLRPALQERIHH